MRLFFYGVLLQGADRWPFLAGLGAGCAARTRGTLYAISDPQGWYPALKPGDGIVHGMLFDAGRVDLAAVDAFEGEEYHRAPVAVDAAAGRLDAQAYLWCAPLPDGAELIVHGDFNRWLADNGRAAFSS